ncbi:MAG: type III pantothenate kinase [Flavobacteriaceae bacterium]|nr:type III pantothenate kinase [Flavobacteriaceae bacterium]
MNQYQTETPKLIIDSGNSAIKYFVFEKEKIIYNKISNRDSIDLVFSSLKMQYPQLKLGIYSDVTGILNNKFLSHKWEEVVFIPCDKNLQLPFSSSYETLETIGSDRLALLAQGCTLNNNSAKLIIDMGSCITYDVLDEENHHLGGAISPGYLMRYKTLAKRTGQLPQLDYKRPKQMWGKSTSQSIHAGINFGIHAEIIYRINECKSKFEELKVIGCGGDIQRLDSTIKNKIFVKPNFLAKGLNHLLELNC